MKMTEETDVDSPTSYLVEDTSKVRVDRDTCANLGSNFIVCLENDEINTDSLEHVRKR